MERMPKARLALLAACLVVATADAAMPSDRRQATATWSAEGLQRIDAPGLDLAYVRPGARLASYRAIALDPVRVSFQRDWERGAAIPTGTRIRSRDLDSIRGDVARVVRHRVARELERGGYAVVEAPGAEVLVLDLEVVNLYLNAPDLPTVSPTDTYTTYFGELTLVGTLRDSRSGEILMRVLDHSIGREFVAPRLTTRADNLHEIGSVAGNWARALHRRLALAGVAHGGSNDRP